MKVIKMKNLVSLPRIDNFDKENVKGIQNQISESVAINRNGIVSSENKNSLIQSHMSTELMEYLKKFEKEGPVKNGLVMLTVELCNELAKLKCGTIVLFCYVIDIDSNKIGMLVKITQYL